MILAMSSNRALELALLVQQDDLIGRKRLHTCLRQSQVNKPLAGRGQLGGVFGAGSQVAPNPAVGIERPASLPEFFSTWTMNLLIWSSLIGFVESRSRVNPQSVSRSPSIPRSDRDQRIGKIGQRPVEVRAIGLLDQFFKRIDRNRCDRDAHQIADQHGVHAVLMCHRKHGLVGSDRVVNSPARDLYPVPTGQRAGQNSHHLDIGKQRTETIGPQLEQDLPIGAIQPGRGVDLSERGSAQLWPIGAGNSSSGIARRIWRRSKFSSSNTNRYCPR